MDGQNRLAPLVSSWTARLLAFSQRHRKLMQLSAWALLIGLLATVLWLRAYDLRSDPPRGVSQSAGFFFDGFANSHAARSYVEFGELRPDEWDPYIYSP
ncbi:MAG: hypothetical protein HN341_06305, partial [Verrucomicrobia bacterium]|nr:hypothetical protein [Verrucomicrobiota bacterium]